MKQKKVLLTLILTFLVFAAPLYAANNYSKVTLEYFDSNSEIEIFDKNGKFIKNVQKGMSLNIGSTIKTYNSTAEIKMGTNNSVLKLSEKSVLKIENLKKTENDFSLFNGKIRLTTIKDPNVEFTVTTQYAICNFKNSDMVMDSIGVLSVKEGLVNYTNIVTDNSIKVASGQIADIISNPFVAEPVNDATINSIFKTLELQGIYIPDNSNMFPQEIASNNDTANLKNLEDDNFKEEIKSVKYDLPNYEEEDAKEDAKKEKGGTAAQFYIGEAFPNSENDNLKEDKKDNDDDNTDKAFQLSINIGAKKYDDIIYAQIALQPIINTENFKAKFFLPITFNDNLLEPGTWYKPSNNNQWSFGSDQDGDLNSMILDAINDLCLKIDYLEFGGTDKIFHLRFGDLYDTNYGYGILVNDYSNNVLFQEDKNFGVQTSLNFKRFGFNALIDNALLPTMWGARLFVAPMGEDYPLEFGLTTVADMYPDSDSEKIFSFFFDPIIYTLAFDVGVPIPAAGMTIFGEFAGITIFKDNKFNWNTFYNSEQPDFFSALNNYGVKTGLKGTVSTFDYKLACTISKGAFIPSVFNSNFTSYKQLQSDNLSEYIDSPNDTVYQKTIIDLAGDFKLTLFDVFSIGIGYNWPWEIFEGDIKSTNNDDFDFTITMEQGMIPFFDIHGSFSYKYSSLVSSLTDSTFDFVGSNSSIEGELTYSIGSSLDINFIFTKFVPIGTNLGIIEDSSNDFKVSLEVEVTL